MVCKFRKKNKVLGSKFNFTLDERKSKLLLLMVFFCSLILVISSVSASRLPTVGGDDGDWGTILNDFLLKMGGSEGIELNQTMVNGTNIYSFSINSTHLLDGTITNEDLGTNSVADDEIDYSEVTISKFTNDANYLDKDEGGVIDGSLIINGNLSLIGNYFNATVTNQYLNGSFIPEMNKLFDLGSSNFFWNNLYSNKIFATDWSNVTIEESQINNLQSYLISETDPIYSAWDKDYDDLINAPAVPIIWDESFNLTGDSRWVDGSSSSSWNDLTNIPEGFDDNVDNDTTYDNLSEFNNDVGFVLDSDDTFLRSDGDNASGMYKFEDNVGIGVNPSSNYRLYVSSNGVDYPTSGLVGNVYGGTAQSATGLYTQVYSVGTHVATRGYGGQFQAVDYKLDRTSGSSTLYGGYFGTKDRAGVWQSGATHTFIGGYFSINNAIGDWTTNNPSVLTYGLYLAAVPTGYGGSVTSYSIYSAGGNAYFKDNITADNFIDHTPGWTGTSDQALEGILNIENTEDNKIDHETLPDFARSPIKNVNFEEGTPMTTNNVIETDKVIETDGRNLGPMVTLLTESVKALDKNIKLKEDKINGFTGDCVNVHFENGLAVACNDN